MKWFEEMSREELIGGAIYLIKRIGEKEAVRKKEERKIAELKKHKKIAYRYKERNQKNGQSGLS